MRKTWTRWVVPLFMFEKRKRKFSTTTLCLLGLFAWEWNLFTMSKGSFSNYYDHLHIVLGQRFWPGRKDDDKNQNLNIVFVLCMAFYFATYYLIIFFIVINLIRFYPYEKSFKKINWNVMTLTLRSNLIYTTIVNFYNN